MGRIVAITEDDLRAIEAVTGLSVPAPLRSVFQRFRAGEDLELEEDQDLSGLGVELQWMTPEEIIDEATRAYPGILAVQRSLLPVGKCLLGSGDPYFLRLSDGALVRVPHDAARGESLDEKQIEVVALSIDNVLTRRAADP
jgi:hypothetical protein